MEDKLKRVLADVFGLDPAEIDDDLSPDNVDAWDSVNHLTLILALEQSFGVSIDPEEAAKLTTLPAIREKLREKGADV